MKRLLLFLVIVMFMLCSSTDAQNIGLKLIADSLTSPLMVVDPTDNTNRLFVIDQAGQIKIIDSTGKLMKTSFLDMTGKMIKLTHGDEERGLLGLAFHPKYSANGRFFIHYSRPSADPNFDHVEYISEFHVSSSNPSVADTAEKVLLTINHPYINHNSGMLAFGPKDGYLYIGMGDGGGGNDTGKGHVEDWYKINKGGNAQNIEANFLGKMLRIDVDHGNPYAIPLDNPLVNKTGLDEIYAYGLRNPYRFSFDMGGTNQLFLGDAGQDLYEEVDIIQNGGNYGWNVKEGNSCFNADSSKKPRSFCPDTDAYGRKLIDPVIQFTNSNADSVNGLGVVIIGGYIYRGQALPQLDGKYIFGSFAFKEGEPSGMLLVSTPDSTQALWPIERLTIADSINANPSVKGQLRHLLLSFGQDHNGEIYVLTRDSLAPFGKSGKIFMMVPAGNPTGVDKLSLIPREYKLNQAYPNPFNPSTTISFEIPAEGQVELKVFDMLGREIKTLVNSELSAGSYHVKLDGSSLSSGVYLYRLKAGSFVKTMKVMLMK